ncbi:hypothetical protein [Tenacibaculum ascidiaceicola]|uniref:hypothetical protein n=1 Tax=Tenacibaculum ascidiaceicola TaxID=1699411 RepID=UPI003893D939
MKNYVLPLMASAILCLVSCSQDKTEDVLAEKTVKTAKPQNLLMYKEMVAMLEHYDKTRKPVLEKALGYEDTRINFYTIETLETYIAYMKKVSEEKGIKLTGINIVSASYPESTSHGTPNYQTTMFMPTTEINGRNIAFAPEASTENKIVTMKEMLGSYGYNWVYDSKEDYDNRDKVNKEIQQNILKREQKGDEESGTGNYGTLRPPY